MQPPTNLCTDSDEFNFDTPTIQEDLINFDNNLNNQSNTSVTQFYQVYSDSDNNCETSKLTKRVQYKNLQKSIRKRRSKNSKIIVSKQSNELNSNNSNENNIILKSTGLNENFIETSPSEFNGFDESISNEFILTNETDKPDVLIQYIKILLKDAVQKEQKIKELQEEFDRRKNEINNLNAIYEKLKKKKCIDK